MTKLRIRKEPLEWRCHTPNLLQEIANCSNQPILVRPLQILRALLIKVAERAIKLDDPEMNKLMCQLTLYSIADPEDPDYNREVVDEILHSKTKSK